MQAAQTPPIPFRRNVAKGTGLSRKVNASLAWGVQFEKQELVSDTNSSASPDISRAAFARYFPRYHTDYRNVHIGDTVGTVADGGIVLDSDVFQRSLFSLENVQVSTGSDDRPVASRLGIC